MPQVSHLVGLVGTQESNRFPGDAGDCTWRTTSLLYTVGSQLWVPIQIIEGCFQNTEAWALAQTSCTRTTKDGNSCG